MLCRRLRRPVRELPSAGDALAAERGQALCLLAPHGRHPVDRIRGRDSDAGGHELEQANLPQGRVPGGVHPHGAGHVPVPPRRPFHARAVSGPVSQGPPQAAAVCDQLLHSHRPGVAHGRHAGLPAAAARHPRGQAEGRSREAQGRGRGEAQARPEQKRLQSCEPKRQPIGLRLQKRRPIAQQLQRPKRQPVW